MLVTENPRSAANLWIHRVSERSGAGSRDGAIWRYSGIAVCFVLLKHLRQMNAAAWA